jgi:hypothetical protein
VQSSAWVTFRKALRKPKENLGGWAWGRNLHKKSCRCILDTLLSLGGVLGGSLQQKWGELIVGGWAKCWFWCWNLKLPRLSTMDFLKLESLTLKTSARACDLGAPFWVLKNSSFTLHWRQKREQRNSCTPTTMAQFSYTFIYIFELV